MKPKNLTIEKRKQKLLNEYNQLETLFACHSHSFCERSRYDIWKCLDNLKRTIEEAEENKDE